MCLAEEIRAALLEERPVEQKTFQGEEIKEMSCEKIEFVNCRFINCRILSCDFSGGYFDRIQFEGCDLSGSDFARSFWKQCSMTDSKAQGSRYVDAVLKKGSFFGCKLDYANFQQSVLEDMRLMNSSLLSAFFSEVKMKRTVFDKVRFEKTDFFRTSFKGIDLSGCDLIQPLVSEDIRELKGAKLNSFQAVDVARMIGIMVQ